MGSVARTGNKGLKDGLERTLLRGSGRHRCMASNLMAIKVEKIDATCMKCKSTRLAEGTR